MKQTNKVLFGILTIFSIAAVSAIAIHTIHNTHKKMIDYSKDIDWDI